MARSNVAFSFEKDENKNRTTDEKVKMGAAKKANKSYCSSCLIRDR